jgi:hypothetical protein
LLEECAEAQVHFLVRLLLLISLAFAVLASAEARRVALVIGNSDYKIGPRAEVLHREAQP